ncbi:hypothetical protein BD408DRAFT_412492 [Parasitella parasitica]|nr:hypothetical protein BD408DRAFT_412492 [Parasitella parasitica]
MVRKILLLEGFKVGSNNAYKIIDSIMQNCPNIQEIHTLFTDQSNLVISCLLDERNQIKRLAKLITLNKWKFLDAAKYEALATKYRKTITHLQLPALVYNEHTRGFSQHQEVEQKLKSFPVLQKLHMANFHCDNVTVLDQLIDSCSLTVYELKFSELFTSCCTIKPPQDSVKPNTTIKKMAVLDGRISTATLYYLSALKLRALEELTWMSFSDNDIEWWKHLANLSLSLKVYDIKVSFSGLISERDQLHECLQIVSNTAPSLDCVANSRTLKLSCLGNRSVIVHGKPNVSMTKTPNSYCLEIDQEDRFNLHILDLLARLQFYSADLINFRFQAAMREIHESFAYRVGMCSSDDESYDSDSDAYKEDMVNATLCAYEFVPSSEIKKALHANRSVNNNEHWSILDGLLTMLDSSKDPKLYLKYIIVFEEQRSAVDIIAQQVAAISFSCSILDAMVLPAISLKLPHIGRLVMDACTILMEKPYNLELFLPTSSIQTLKLVVRPLAEGLSLFPDYDYFACQLENRELLEAVSPTGHYILKIETDTKTHVSKRQSGRIIDGNFPDMTTGTSSDFLIYIKCKRLKQFLLTDDPVQEQGFESFER